MRRLLDICMIALLAMTFAGGAAAKGKSAEEAYNTLMEEIRVLEQGARTQQQMMEAVLAIEKKLKGFIGEYPKSVEAKDAKFQLGLMYSSLMQSENAITYLNEFVRSETDSKSEKLGYAHFYLAEAYKNTDKFELAKKHYKIVTSEFPGLNPQFIQMASTNLDDIETLRQLSVGKEPVPFHVEDLKGRSLSPAKFKGKVVLIDFWATWCGPCIVEMPNVIKLYKKYKDKGFEIIGISLDRDRRALDDYIKRNKIEWPQFYDGQGWGNSVAAKYKVRAIPATFLIDRQGKIRHKTLRGEALEEAVAALLNEK